MTNTVQKYKKCTSTEIQLLNTTQRKSAIEKERKSNRALSVPKYENNNILLTRHQSVNDQLQMMKCQEQKREREMGMQLVDKYNHSWSNTKRTESTWHHVQAMLPQYIRRKQFHIGYLQMYTFNKVYQINKHIVNNFFFLNHLTCYHHNRITALKYHHHHSVSNNTAVLRLILILTAWYQK